MLGTEDLLSAFDVNKFGTEALLFQTGYLTITEEQELGGKALYRLGCPNREVRQSLNEHLLRHLVQDSDRQTANSIRLARLLEAHDCAGMKELFHYQWYTNNTRNPRHRNHRHLQALCADRTVSAEEADGIERLRRNPMRVFGFHRRSGLLRMEHRRLGGDAVEESIAQPLPSGWPPW